MRFYLRNDISGGGGWGDWPSKGGIQGGQIYTWLRGGQRFQESKNEQFDWLNFTFTKTELNGKNLHKIRTAFFFRFEKKYISFSSSSNTRISYFKIIKTSVIPWLFRISCIIFARTINCEPPCIYVPLVESRYGLQLQLVGETSGCSYNRRPPPHSRRE